MIVHSSLKVILVLVYIVSLIKCIFIPNISLLSIMHLLLYHIHIYTNFTFNYLLPPPENPLPNTVSPKSYAWHRTALVHKHDGISKKNTDNKTSLQHSTILPQSRKYLPKYIGYSRSYIIQEWCLDMRKYANFTSRPVCQIFHS